MDSILADINEPPRESKPDLILPGHYVGQLYPPSSILFVQGDRTSARVNVTAHIHYSFTGIARGVAFGSLDSSRSNGSVSSLTRFLQTFGLLERAMSTAQCIRAAADFIRSEPLVGISVTWIGYSHLQKRTVARCMEHFPRRPDGTHDTVMVVNGETIRAKPRITQFRRPLEGVYVPDGILNPSKETQELIRSLERILKMIREPVRF
jgi:hypothetical protein